MPAADDLDNDFERLLAEHQPNETDPDCRICGEEYPCDIAWAAGRVLDMRDRRMRRSEGVNEVDQQATDVDLTGAAWEKSKFSSGNTDNCVEVAFVGTAIAVRDSKNRDGGAQVYDRGEWQAFLDGVKSGQFDLG